MCIQGSAPGRVVATLTHQGRVRQIPMTVDRHASGGWHVLQQDGTHGPRCHAVSTAILLEASDSFVGEDSVMEAA